MEPKYRFRLYLLTAFILAGCGTLLSRLYEFQIDRRAQFVANIPTTHTVEIREPGVRGPIVDRNGVVLARNRRSYEIIFNLEDIYQGYQEVKKVEDQKKDQSREDEKKTLAQPVDKEIVRIVREWVVPKLESMGLTGDRFTDNIRSHYNKHGGLVPYPYRRDLTPDEFAQIAVRCHEIPGVEVRVMPRRVYPYGALAGHLLGYVQQWALGDIPEEYLNKKNKHYQGDVEGLTGVEFTTNQYLKGKGGKTNSGPQ